LVEKTQALTAEITKRALSPVAAATYAFYDPPWTLGFLRRNEVMIAVRK
jgi:SOUL heme-binding protein